MKTFKTTNDDNSVIGTALRGYVEMNFVDLCCVFGQPNYYEDNKMKAQWIIETDDGTIITIYDYKEDHDPEYHIRWHVGGFNTDAVLKLKAILDQTDAEYNKVIICEFDRRLRRHTYTEVS